MTTRGSQAMGSTDPRDSGRGKQDRVRFAFPLVEENGEVRLQLSGTSPFKVDGGRGLAFNVGSEFTVSRGSPYALHLNLDGSLKRTINGISIVVPSITEIPRLGYALDSKANIVDMPNTSRGYNVNANLLEGYNVSALIAYAIAASQEYLPLMGSVQLDGTGSTSFYVPNAVKSSPVTVCYSRGGIIGTVGILSADVTDSELLTIDSIGGISDESYVFYCISRFP